MDRREHPDMQRGSEHHAGRRRASTPLYLRHGREHIRGKHRCHEAGFARRRHIPDVRVGAESVPTCHSGDICRAKVFLTLVASGHSSLRVDYMRGILRVVQSDHEQHPARADLRRPVAGRPRESRYRAVAGFARGDDTAAFRRSFGGGIAGAGDVARQPADDVDILTGQRL